MCIFVWFLIIWWLFGLIAVFLSAKKGQLFNPVFNTCIGDTCFDIVISFFMILFGLFSLIIEIKDETSVSRKKK